MSQPQGRHQRRPDRAALVIAGVLALVGVLIAYGAYYSDAVMAYTPVGPKTVPFIIAAAFFALAAGTTVQALRGNFPEREAQNLPPMAWIVGGLVIQLLTMKTFGFSIATGLLFAATAKGFGRGPLWFTIPIGIVFSFAVWFVFAKGLQLSLPAGPLERLF